MKEVIKILKGMKKQVSDQEFINRHKKDETSFARKKKLDFATMYFFVLTLIKQNLDFDREHFSKYFNVKVVSSAITQRRSQIKYTAFEEMLEYTASKIKTDKYYKGYHLIAADGMRGELPRQKELIEEYGLRKNDGYPQFHAVSFYDVLNEVFLCAKWGKHPCDERSAVIDLIKNKNIAQNSIFLLDRGFTGIELIKTFEDSRHNFVLRANTTATFSEIKQFLESNKTDSEITIYYDRKRANWNKHKSDFIELPYSVNLRFIKIILNTGEVEVLITNLSADEFSAEEIGELYNLRWGIETCFNHLKNAVHVETFIGIKNNSIKQEFFASLIVYNLAKSAAKEAQKIYDSKKN